MEDLGEQSPPNWKKPIGLWAAELRIQKTGRNGGTSLQPYMSLDYVEHYAKYLVPFWDYVDWYAKNLVPFGDYVHWYAKNLVPFLDYVKPSLKHRLPNALQNHYYTNDQ